MQINLSRGNFRTWAVGVLATGFFGFAAGSAALFPDRFLVGGAEASTGTRVMAWLCTFLFLIPFVALLFGSPKLLGRRLLTIDATGIQPIPWSDLEAVGVAYKVSPRGVKLGYVLELFPANGADLTDRIDGLMTATEEPPREDLPRDRQRLPLSDQDDVHAKIEQAVTAYAPSLWLGVYRRDWQPLA